MGWITTHRDKGTTNDEWFQKECFGEGRTILASSTVKNTYYAAVRQDDTGEVWAAVILITRAPRAHHNFGWKSMTEHMGPCEASAPAKVLDVLTETDNQYALEWRAECRKNLELAKTTLAAGTTIELAHPLGFQVGGPGQGEWTLVKTARFIYAPMKRRLNVFRALTEDGGSFLVTLPGWKSYNYQVVSS